MYDNETFTYDKNGNRMYLKQNGDTYRYTYGERNRLEKVEVKREGEAAYVDFIEYVYDANGNTIERTIHGLDGDEVIDFEYDTLNRLVKTTKGTEVTEYYYDNAGNRFMKKESDTSAIKSFVLYLRHGQIAVAMDIEIPEDDATIDGKTNRYVLSGDLLAGRMTSTYYSDTTTEIDVRSFYHLDHLNSTKCVTDAGGAVEVMYEYLAFGEQLKRLDGNGNETGDSATYSYSGKELDDGTNLYYFNARYYDATIGRFINVDPVQDGSNWYVYVNNNPLCFVDPTGLSGILAIYSKDGGDDKWGHSWISFTDDASGETTTYGTWPTGPNTGKLFENFEKIYIKDDDFYVSRETKISDEQQDTLNDIINNYKSKDDKAWSLYDPCSSFAGETWNKITGEKLSHRDIWIISNPNTLVKSIIMANIKNKSIPSDEAILPGVSSQSENNSTNESADDSEDME